MTRNILLDQTLRLFYFITFGMIGCATSPEVRMPPEPSISSEAQQQIQDLRHQVSTLSGRLEMLELKLATSNQLKTPSSPHSGEPHDIPSGVSDEKKLDGNKDSNARSTPSDDRLAEKDTITAYKKGLDLLEQKKYPEAMLAFTSFLDLYADHPWAGAAQFYSGQSYFFQNEYRLALQEYERVLTSYDRSPYVSDALHQIAWCEEALKLSNEANNHRLLLTTLFPKSPHARKLADHPGKGQNLTPPTAPPEGT